MRSMLKRTFKLIGTIKKGRTIDYVGYSPEQLMLRLEMNFTKYMNWGNYGTYWEIDHKIPMSYLIRRGVTDPKIVNMLCNLQPLTCTKNREKSAKLVFLQKN